LGALLVLTALPALAAPGSPMRLVVFGDSLLDSGNVYQATRFLGMSPAFPPSAPPYRRYWEGRFSNGPNVADYLASRICGGLSTPSVAVLDRVAQTCSVNFAFGGATAGYWNQTPGSVLGPGFRAQVELFAAAADAPGAAIGATLFVVWVGADDYLYVSPAPAPKTVVGHIKAGVQSLYQLGARRFVVLDLPDLGNLPMSAGTPSAARLTQATDAHNRYLAIIARDLNAALPGIDVRLVPVSALAKSLAIRPDAGPAAGCIDRFLRMASACRSLDESLFYSERGFPPPQPGFFWDELHPTTRAHRRIFEALEQTVAAPQR
jgi:phospholipase/lecithinase/hemolysin